jgi:UDP-glucose 4-epimerase
LLECIRNKNPIEINDPYPKRDYLNIKDFQQLISRIISKEPIISGIFNVGYGRSYSNLEVAEIVRELAGEPRNIIIKSKRRQSDILECSADISLIKKTFSWEPGITLEAGLSELIATIKEQK